MFEIFVQFPNKGTLSCSRSLVLGWYPELCVVASGIGSLQAHSFQYWQTSYPRDSLKCTFKTGCMLSSYLFIYFLWIEPDILVEDRKV